MGLFSFKTIVILKFLSLNSSPKIELILTWTTSSNRELPS